MVVALAVELSGAGQFKPSFQGLGHGAISQGAFGVAWVVGFNGLDGLCMHRGMVVPTRLLVKILP